MKFRPNNGFSIGFNVGIAMPCLPSIFDSWNPTHEMVIRGMVDYCHTIMIIGFILLTLGSIIQPIYAVWTFAAADMPHAFNSRWDGSPLHHVVSWSLDPWPVFEKVLYPRSDSNNNTPQSHFPTKNTNGIHQGFSSQSSVLCTSPGRHGYQRSLQLWPN